MGRLTTLFLLITTCCVAQDGTYSLGAAHRGMAGSSITKTDLFALFNNIGGFGSLEKAGAFITYQNRYAIKSFQVIGGGFAMHSKLLNVGVKYFKFGDDLFSQQLVGLGMANRIQGVSIGMGVNIIQTAAEGQPTDRALALELGGRAVITPQLLFGACIFNLRHTKNHPTNMKAGLSFLPAEPLTIHLEAEKQLGFPELIKLGLEYQVLEKLTFRTGINRQRHFGKGYQVTSALGMGIYPGKVRIDYAFCSAQDLGAIHELSLRYQLTEK